MTKPRLTTRKYQPEDTVIELGGVKFSSQGFTVIAGPCAVESHDQAFATAEIVKNMEVKLFRGGAFKPRTSPYSFQGLGKEGLEILADVKSKYGLLIVSEATDVENAEAVADVCDIIQIGARNMQHYSLLKKVAGFGKPVLLKRGLASTIEEFMLAAEYILADGNPNVILCERGVRSTVTTSRNVIDFAALQELKKRTHLPIIVDPSHASGCRDAVLPLSQAALVTGADGLMVEVHCQPEAALSDGPQSINGDQFETLMSRLKNISQVVEKPII